MKVVLDYLKQPSTWRGLVGVVAAFGVAMSPDQVEAIIAAGVAAIGVVEVFRNEEKK